MRSRWKRIRYRLEWLGLLLATKLIPLCSRTVCYHIAQAAGALLSFVDRPRYQVALSNLEVAFGDRVLARGSDEKLPVSHSSISPGPWSICYGARV